jgi:hypothetical protein
VPPDNSRTTVRRLKQLLHQWGELRLQLAADLRGVSHLNSVDAELRRQVRQLIDGGASATVGGGHDPHTSATCPGRPGHRPSRPDGDRADGYAPAVLAILFLVGMVTIYVACTTAFVDLMRIIVGTMQVSMWDMAFVVLIKAVVQSTNSNADAGSRLIPGANGRVDYFFFFPRGDSVPDAASNVSTSANSWASASRRIPFITSDTVALLPILIRRRCTARRIRSGRQYRHYLLFALHLGGISCGVQPG